MSKIKSSLKSKDGMALPMVLIVMLILTVFGTALYMLAWNSFMTVRHMNEQKRAYYFARAGVEFAAYAYQMADMQAIDGNAEALNLINFSKSEAFSNSKEETIKTNTIYVVPSPDEGTGKWEGLSFERTPNANAIGEFTVQIGNGIEKVNMTDSKGNASVTSNTVKAFQSIAKAYITPLEVDGEQITNADSLEAVTEYANAYLAATETAEPLSFYTDKGVLKGPGDGESYTSDEDKAGNVTAEDKKSKFLKIHDEREIDGINIKPASEHKFFLFRLLEILKESLIKRIFVEFYGTKIDIDLYIKTAEGNLILSKPTSSSIIKTREKAHNYYIFATPEDLFLSGCGLNVVPTKGYYNSVGLYGDEIVIDGDIIMGVYYTKTDGFGSKFEAIINTLGNRYRLGTVMLGEGSNYLTTRKDPVPVNEGGIQFGGVSVPANKVYFNGNVYVKIFNQGGATETYRVFNAGDMAYFYGGYTEIGTDQNKTNPDGSKKTVEAKGIDLLKYFLDAVIDEKDGFNYGSALIDKAKAINELYYTGELSDSAYDNKDTFSEENSDPTPYFNDKTVLVRKIDVKYDNGNVKVDGDHGSVLDIIQPSNIGATNIKWGIPEGGSVFNPKDNNTY